MRPILETAWAEGNVIAVPKVFGEEMRFFYIQAYEETAPGIMVFPNRRAERKPFVKMR